MDKSKEETKQETKKLSVYFNGMDYMIANSPERAKLECECVFDKEHMDHEEAGEFKLVSHNTNIPVQLEDGCPALEKTAAEWAKDHGFGYLCSVDF